MRNSQQDKVRELIRNEIEHFDVAHWYKKDFASDVCIGSKEDLMSGEFTETDIEDAFNDYIYEYRDDVVGSVLVGYILDSLHLKELPDEWRDRLYQEDIEELVGEEFVEDVYDWVRDTFWDAWDKIYEELCRTEE